MSASKYPALTVTIEERITQGVYRDKLPTTRQLAEEFAVSRQTVTNALRPLIDDGILVSDRRRGVSIRKPKLERGLIGIVATGDLNRLIGDPPLSRFQQRIKSDGFEPILLTIYPDTNHKNICKLLGSNFTGLIFTNSSLTLEIAESLERQEIPFISCNRLPVYSRLNFVEHDWNSAIRQLAAEYAVLGYKRQNLFFQGRLEGYDRLIRKSWSAIKKELKLPRLAADEIELDYRKPSLDAFAEYLKKLKESGEYPDILIIWTGFSEKMAKLTGSGPLKLPDNCRIISLSSAHLPPSPQITLFNENNNQYDLLLEAYEGLRELLAAPSGKLIHRKVEYRFSKINEHNPNNIKEDPL